VRLQVGNTLIKSEPRSHATLTTSFLVFLLAVFGALLLGSIFLAFAGFSPLSVYQTMLKSAAGSSRNISETLVAAVPLILTGTAAAVAFKMLVWNIGGEGQLYGGAIAAAGVAILFGTSLPPVIAIPLLIIAGAAGGAAWSWLAAGPRVYLGTNEIILTIMLNFIGAKLLEYLIFGSFSPWRDSQAMTFPQGRPLDDAWLLPEIWGRLDIGIIFAVLFAVASWWALRYTRWGYEVRVAGDSARTAEYGGIRVNRKILSVFLLSGAAAGVAGAVLVGGVVGSLEPRSLILNLGYTGIIVAALARLNPLAVIPAAIFVGALNNAGSALQIAKVPDAIVGILQGAILLFAVGGEWLVAHKFTIERAGAPATEAVEHE
jgi:simple sugar transport system permease protein